MACARVTVSLPADLVEAANKRADAESRNLSSLVRVALNAYLMPKPTAEKPLYAPVQQFTIKSMKGEPYRPELDGKVNANEFLGYPPGTLLHQGTGLLYRPIPWNHVTGDDGKHFLAAIVHEDGKPYLVNAVLPDGTVVPGNRLYDEAEFSPPQWLKDGQWTDVVKNEQKKND